MTLPTKEAFLNENPWNECPICYHTTFSSFTTSCSHNFCMFCWFDWFDRNNTCPMCRTKLYEDPQGESEEEEDMQEELAQGQLGDGADEGGEFISAGEGDGQIGLHEPSANGPPGVVSQGAMAADRDDRGGQELFDTLERELEDAPAEDSRV